MKSSNLLLILTFSTILFINIPRISSTIVVRDGAYNEDITVRIDNQNEYIYWFKSARSANPHRVMAVTNKINNNYPVMIVVTQEKQITSWEIPLIVNSKSRSYEFYNTSRTLCFSSLDFFHTFYRSQLYSMFDVNKRFSLSIATFSQEPVNVTIKVTEVNNYYIENNVNYTITMSPGQPSFYYYSFLTNKIKNETIFIDVRSMDDHCIIVSLQRSFCPVRDLNNDITYEGNYLTMNTRGSLYTSKREFPEGFFLVFVVRGDNYECSDYNTILPGFKTYDIQAQNKQSTLTFKITEGISKEDALKAILIILGAYLGFVVFFIILTFGIYKYKNRNRSDEVDESIRTDKLEISDIVTYEEDAITLVYLDTKDTNNIKASNYCYHIANIGLFYGIPVIQLMFSYNRSVELTGNQDICYHNFMCAHPVFNINDFNHIYSNIGYFLVGILYIVLVTCKKYTTKCAPHDGIPKYYGLFYAMGIGLIFEGFFSASYHICPNQTNFQFDTSFMYTMALLIMIKLYQNRHPDLNATAYATFSVLGIAVLLAMIGIMTNSIIVLIFFLISYFSLCTYLSFKIYFFGHVLETIRRLYNDVRENNQYRDSIIPIRKRLFCLLLIVNILNLTMASVGVYFYPLTIDFGTYLLMLLMGNAILHMMFYTGMKLYYRETLCVEAIIYGVLALTFWIPSGYFFFNASTLWSVTPAESRKLNTECLLLKFFDGHDIWHMLSAPALFFSFMLLLTIDDNLNDTHKVNINVF